MRVSVRHEDPANARGAPSWYNPMRPWVIFLNGCLVHDIITADTDEGYLLFMSPRDERWGKVELYRSDCLEQ